jgi:diguanylate cyclase (GGDEF)-like protein
MKKPTYKFKQLSFSGGVIFTFYTLAFAVVHFGILVLSLILQIWPVVIYQLFPVCWYLFCYIKKSKALNTTMYTISIIEVILNSIVCTYFFGWSFGFHIYLFLIPIKTYFVSYHMRVHNLGKLPPFPYSMAAFVTAVLLRSLSARWTLGGITSNSTLHKSVYDANLVIYFSAVLFLLMAFYASIREMELELERKNTLLTTSAADLKSKNEDLRHTAATDYLTGVLNRRSIMPCFYRLQEQFEQSGTPFCVVIGDIDNFKQINDTYGHNIGDEILIALTGSISDNLSGNDRICRWGGEEFLLLLANSDMSRAQDTMEHIRSNLQALRITSGSQDITCSMTFGVEIYTGQSFDLIIQQADEKLYYGKRTGKNRVVIKIPEVTAAVS